MNANGTGVTNVTETPGVNNFLDDWGRTENASCPLAAPTTRSARLSSRKAASALHVPIKVHPS